MSIEELWNDMLIRIEQKISQSSYETWLKDTKPRDLKDNKLTVEVKNAFQKDWLINQYTDPIERILYKLTEKEIRVVFEIVEEPVIYEPLKFSTTTSDSIQDLRRMIEKLESRVSELEEVVNNSKNTLV